MTLVRIRVPATSANLGPGFDSLGMALAFYNHFEASPADTLSVEILPATCVDVDGLSLDLKQNLMAQAYMAYFAHRNTPVIPAKLGIEAHVPLSRGLGSSSSAIVAGLVLANALHPGPLPKEALLPLAVELEGHPDNVAPALLGGVLCCVNSGRVLRYDWPQEWGIWLVVPPTPLSTHAARGVLPTSYEASDVVENIRAMAAWTRGLETADSELFHEALQADTVHQPARAALIPEFALLQTVLRDQPAMGPIISGAGSTLAVYSPDSQAHRDIGEALRESESLAHCRVFAVKPDDLGAHQA